MAPDGLKSHGWVPIPDDSPDLSTGFANFSDAHNEVPPSYEAHVGEADYTPVGEADYKPIGFVNSATQPNKYRQRLEWLWPWRFQVATLGASLIGLLILIIVLGSFNNQPLSTWSSNFLSVNALVAIVSTAIRALLMASVAGALAQAKWLWFSNAHDRNHGRRFHDLDVMDAASRGPLGSARLLFRIRNPLAWYGALLTLLALGFETASQQVVNIATRPIPTTISSITRTENFTYADYNDRAWAWAKYSGIFSQNLPLIPASCQTGNCTWPTTPSLAACGKCVDITHQLNATCNGNYCNYTTPAGPALTSIGANPYESLPELQLGNLALMNAPAPNSNFSLAHTNSGQVTEQPSYPVFSVGPGTGAALGMQNIIDLPIQPIVLISTINVYDDISPDQSWLTFSAPEAFDCAITFCIASYNVELFETRETQHLVADSGFNSTESWEYNYGFPPNAAYADNVQVSDYSYDVRVPDTVFWGDESTELNGTMALLSAGGSISWMSLASNENPFIGPDVSHAFREIASGPGSLPNMTLWIEGLAQTFSYQIQTAGTNNTSHDAPFNGTMYTLEPVIDVRWGWLALPIFLVMGSAVFVFASIISTERSNVRPWKDSSLALAFVGVDPRLQKLIGRATFPDEEAAAEATIRNQRVCLVEEADRKWTFKLVSS